jgi:hypothetical protein
LPVLMWLRSWIWLIAALRATTNRWLG